MKRYQSLLCEFLVYRADNYGSLPEVQAWRPGGAVPQVSRKETVTSHGPTFKAPIEYLCPISSEVMEDPVSTMDGFTYERKSIQRW